MKCLAALCLVISTAACNPGGPTIRTEHWEVPSRPATGDSEHWNVPNNPAADEDAVRYTPTFTQVRSTSVCEDSHSLLEGPDGARFILSRPLRHGEFSTFHYALDRDGTLRGVKRVPLHAASGQRPGVTEQDLGRQLALWDAVHPTTPVSNALLRHGNDAYALMPLMDDSVAALEALNTRSTLARQMVQQVAGDAARLHALGFVHHDVRTQNILWKRDGSMALADYHLARHLEPDGQLQRTAWYVVATAHEGVAVRELIAAPEMRSGRHDTKADTWSLGLAALEVLLGKNELFDALQAELAHGASPYTHWRSSVVGLDGHAHLDRIHDPARVHVPPSRRLFDEAFSRALRQDPELTQAILEGMLVESPAERWSMQQVQEHAPSTPREVLAAALEQHSAHHGEARRARREALHRCAAQLPPAAPQPGLAQDPRNTRRAEASGDAQRQAFMGMGQDPCAPADPLGAVLGAVSMPAAAVTVDDSGTSVRF